MPGRALELSKVTRSCIVKGEWYSIECAVRADGSSPAREFLDLLAAGMWESDPDVDKLPDDEQVRDYSRLIDVMLHVAKHGEPRRSGDVQYLHHGIWEFKVFNKRLAFYDTDGVGGYTEKPRIRDIAASPNPDTDHWWFPEMDYTLRLANSWPKTGELADPLDIEEARLIREEDLRYDK
jgi:hypothetical protein